MSQKYKKAASLSLFIKVFTPNIEIPKEQVGTMQVCPVKIIENSAPTFFGILNAIFPLSFHGARIGNRDLRLRLIVKSRVNREVHARFCERLGGLPTRLFIFKCSQVFHSRCPYGLILVKF